MIDHALFDQRLQNRSGPARSDAPASEALPASDRSNRRSQRANLSDNQSRGLLLASKAGPILESASGLLVYPLLSGPGCNVDAKTTTREWRNPQSAARRIRSVQDRSNVGSSLQDISEEASGLLFQQGKRNH